VFRKKKKKEEPKPWTLEDWIHDLILPPDESWTLERTSIDALSEQKPDSFVLLEYQGLKQEGVFAFMASESFCRARGIAPQTRNHPDLLKWSSPLAPLFYLEPSPEVEAEWEQPFFYSIQSFWPEEQYSSLMWKLSSLQVIQCSPQEGPGFYLLIETHILAQIDQRLAKDPGFQEASRTFLKDQPGERHKTIEKDPLILPIDDPLCFMAGRYFLPLELRRQPPVIQSQIHQLVLSAGAAYFSQPGLWFRAVIQTEEMSNPLPVYYYFPPSAKTQQIPEKEAFSPLIKMMLRHLKHQLGETGFHFKRFSVDFCEVPPKARIGRSYIFSFRLFSERSAVDGELLIPFDLVALIVQKIADPWTLRLTADNPLNQLRMLYSLNREVERQKLLPLLPSVGEQVDPEETDKVEKLREGFITLADLLGLSSLWEIRQILTNFLYRQGWTGATLPRLFYYVQAVGEGEKIKARRYKLAGFSEERLLRAMPRNMADQWPSQTGRQAEYLNYTDWSQENFLVLKELYRQTEKGSVTLPFRQHQLLKQAFLEYLDRLKIFGKHYVDQQKHFWDPYMDRKRELQDYFYHISSDEGALLFAFTPEELKLMKGIIPPAKLDQIKVTIQRFDRDIIDRDEQLSGSMEKRQSLVLYMQEERI